MSSRKFLLLMVVVISATTVILFHHMMFKAAAMMMCSLMVVSVTMMMRAKTVVSAKCSNEFSEKSTAEEVTETVDGSGLTAIITGASSGIGAETARVFALRGTHIVMGVRNIDVVAAENVKEAILKQIPTAKLDIIELDLSSLESVRNFESKYKASGLPLNILVNNAGMMGPFKLSKDEIELTFATNYLGHFLLTNLLLETMKETAQQSGKEGRIVIVASEGHRFSYRGGICFDKINSPSRYNKVASYGQSKLAIILYANELARRLKEDGSNVIVNSLHPGLVDTTFITLNKFIDVIARAIVGSRLKTVQQGAATTCYVALHPQVKGLSGEYFANSNLSTASSLARDLALGKKLWDFSINLVNTHKAK